MNQYIFFVYIMKFQLLCLDLTIYMHIQFSLCSSFLLRYLLGDNSVSKVVLHLRSMFTNIYVTKWMLKKGGGGEFKL